MDGLIALTKMLDDSTPDAELVETFRLSLTSTKSCGSSPFQTSLWMTMATSTKAAIRLYQDVKGRFHLVPHDNNESLRFGRSGRGGPGGRGPGGWSWGDLEDGLVSPVTHENNAGRPLIKRLLANPQWRARYLAHVRTVVDEWLDWEVFEPIIKNYQTLIDAEVQQDDKKLYGYEEFATGVSRGP